MTTYSYYFIAVVILAVALREIAKFVPWQSTVRAASWAFWGLAVLMFIGTSFTTIDQESIGHLKRVYLASDMKPGQIIAHDSEKGPQARILGPGLHTIPFVNILYNVDEFPLVVIPDGRYGILVAKDGEPLAPGQFIAKRWKEKEFSQMLNAEYFLTHGGQKGPQLSVLKPGAYRINRYLFDVNIKQALNVKAGEVAVIKSNVAEADACPEQENLAKTRPQSQLGSALSLPVVPNGCIGVWEKPLLPGRYYLNQEAYMPTVILTRAQTWVYSGGYNKRLIVLSVDDTGRIIQEITNRQIPEPKDAADKAVIVMIEGWRVPLDVWVVVQVEPNNAARVVASVGGLREVEDRIVTPALRSIVRNVAGAPERRVLDLIDNRGTLETRTEQALFPEGLKAGVTIKEVRFGDPVIPAALLVARQRQQLADQLNITYERERISQEKRIDVEKSRATADQQGELVRAQISVQVAKQEKKQSQLRGEGEKLRLIEVAEGQKAQTNVLDKDRVYDLAVLDKALAAAVRTPDIVKIPNVYVQGAGQGFEGPAAILGASNLVQSIAANAERRDSKQ